MLVSGNGHSLDIFDPLSLAETGFTGRDFTITRLICRSCKNGEARRAHVLSIQNSQRLFVWMQQVSFAF